MALSPTLETFLRQVRGDASGGVVGLLTDMTEFRSAIEELAAGAGTAVDFQEEGASVVIGDTVNFVGAGATVTDVGGVATVTIPGGGGGGGAVIHVTYELANNTNAKGSLAATYIKSDLNTVNKNTIVGASLASNQITLPAGDYHVKAWQMCYRGGKGKVRLRDVTNSVSLVIGASHYQVPVTSDGQGGTFPVDGYFSLAGTADLELQMFVSATVNPAGFGVRVNAGDPEVYGMVEITEL